MSTYPQMPPAPPPTTNEGINHDASNSMESGSGPEVPSNAWLWLVLSTIALAIGFQGCTLLKLSAFDEQISDFDKRENKFEAEKASWEKVISSREDAFNDWKSLEDQARSGTEDARRQSNQLQGTIKELREQQNKLDKSIAEQNQILTDLNSDLEKANSQLLKRQAESATLDAENREKSEKQSSLSNEYMNLENLLAEIAIQQEDAEEELQSKKQLITREEARIKKLETKLSDYQSRIDKAISSKQLDAAARLKLEEQKAKQLKATN